MSSNFFNWGGIKSVSIEINGGNSHGHNEWVFGLENWLSVAFLATVLVTIGRVTVLGAVASLHVCTTGLKPGMWVLDVGCGVGGPAQAITRFADIEVIGLNNNEFQAGLEGQVTFVRGDFMKLEEQFGKNYFDAVYAIEATCHAPTWEGVYGEIFKVLKPGGIVSTCFSQPINLTCCLRTLKISPYMPSQLGHGTLPRWHTLQGHVRPHHTKKDYELPTSTEVVLLELLRASRVVVMHMRQC
ncbi:S-adenosyl-L-methionine-dependent methyltransferase [Mycena sp. CBHHK59/15]|nr:S-adenosyl-L-methionine-dependent methyltransferase [Mycena sp. CBHHK59/15]